jgi:hypothetical protein
MFDYFDSISKRTPFHPRYSHCGYRSDKPGKDRDNRGKLQKYLQSDKKIMDQ